MSRAVKFECSVSNCLNEEYVSVKKMIREGKEFTSPSGWLDLDIGDVAENRYIFCLEHTKEWEEHVDRELIKFANPTTQERRQDE